MASKQEAEGGCWPTEEQELLLKAALLKDTRGLEAFTAWRGQTDFDHPDPGSLRLFPMLYRNLVSLGLNDPVVNILKGFYRRALYKNHLLMHSLLQVLSAFNRAKIDTMLLKGAAVTVTSYRDYGLRPMNDFDILVRPQSLQSAVHLLAEEGWAASDPTLRDRMFTRIRHACEFEHPSGQVFDLHQYIFQECCFDGVDEPFWQKALIVDVNGLPARVLDNADQFLHTAVHGTLWNDVPPIRWAADAVMLLRQDNRPFSWNRLLEQAGRLSFTLALRDTLSYLKERLNQPIPAEVLSALAAKRSGILECLENRTRLYPAGSLPSYAGFLLRYLRFPPCQDLRGSLNRISGFPDYLRRFWCLDGTGQVPGFIFRKGLGALKRALGWR
jgi:hypothetical protein